MNEKMERQAELEKLMSGLGSDRFKRDLEKARGKQRESTMPYGKVLLARGVDAVAAQVRAFIAKAESGGPGRRHLAVKYLKQVDPEVSAFIALKAVLDGVTHGQPLQKTATAVARLVHNEARFTKFEAENKAYFRKVRADLNSRTESIERKQVVLVHSMNKLGVEWESWPQSHMLHIGIKLIECVIDGTGYVEMRMHHRKKNDTIYHLVLTKKVAEWINKKCGECEFLSPVFLPCVVPPRDWTSPMDGGYHTAAVPPLRLVKTRQRRYQEELANRADDMPALYETVNALQRTGWAVNKAVLDVAQALWTAGGGVANMPPTDDLPLPPKPALDLSKEARQEWTPSQQEEWKGWKRRASCVHAENVRLRSKRLLTLKTLWVAEKYLDEEAFYFPYQLDFRGRIYAVPYYLQPQGNDLSKGLLQFAKGKALTEDYQADWLAIHGANTWGNDKVSLPERVDWVADNEEMILAIAKDPLTNMEWTNADKPFQFLAFCFEWAGFLEEGFGYVSHLPVAMDGSCNGIQIFSLALRDAVGGAAVNLVPSDRPADIYQVVADKVTAKLVEAARGEGEDATMARQWLEFGIDRKATKRQVMVLPYGGTMRSCINYTEEYIRARMEKGDTHPWTDLPDLFKPAVWLARFIWGAINETVVAARACMDWLQKCARIVAKEDLPVNWTTPVGFPVLQAYNSLERRRVETKIGDSVIKLTMVKDVENKVDRRRQSNGISPNFVHSLDAAALMLSVQKALRHGVDHFAMVHDSYGTHAADAPVMAQCLRDAFVEMFTDHDPLEEFLKSIRAQVKDPDELPPIPEKGTLDINLVRESPFFFA